MARTEFSGKVCKLTSFVLTNGRPSSRINKWKIKHSKYCKYLIDTLYCEIESNFLPSSKLLEFVAVRLDNHDNKRYLYSSAKWISEQKCANVVKL